MRLSVSLKQWLPRKHSIRKSCDAFIYTVSTKMFLREFEYVESVNN